LGSSTLIGAAVPSVESRAAVVGVDVTAAVEVRAAAAVAAAAAAAATASPWSSSSISSSSRLAGAVCTAVGAGRGTGGELMVAATGFSARSYTRNIVQLRV
jgi:hypothetical protein